MATVSLQHESPSAHGRAEAERVHEWMPPQRIRRYQWAKLVGAAFFAAIFGGWLYLQWSNPLMRWVAGGLLLLTVVLTAAAHVEDARRSRSGRLRVRPGDGRATLELERAETTTRVDLADVARAVWRTEPTEQRGLWLYDSHGRALAHIDAAFVAHEAEARTFLGWLRTACNIRLKVSWPAAESV